jgi:fatty-acyl-CoA synthase
MKESAPLHPDAHPITVGALLGRAAARHGSREALVDADRRLSYRDYEREVDRIAWGLAKTGVVRGQHVALWMRNRVEWVLVELAILKLGAVLVPLNTRYSRAEADYVLRQSDCATLIVEGEPAGVDLASLPRLERVIGIGDGEVKGRIPFSTMVAEEPDVPALAALVAEVGVEDIAIIIYTSGTTAFPKGVMLAHGQITRNIYEVRVVPEELTSADRVLFVLPMCHIMGALNSVVGMLHVGGCLILRPGFAPLTTLEAVQEERPTWFYGVTSMFVDLLSSGLINRYETTSLRRFTLFPGPFQAGFLAELIAAFKAEGLNTRYGLTETTNGLTMVASWRDGVERVASSIGKVVCTTEFEIVDPDTRRPVDCGKDGEIRVRGFNVMKGYYNKPEETRKVMDEQGWFYTGDLASADDEGYVYFKGRIKDTLKTLGNNVSCLEVEEVLTKHAAVLMAVLIGVPDPRASEVGVAFVQLRPGATCTDEDLVAHCRSHLAGYKVPRHVRVISDFPLSSSGKVQKTALRERFLEEANGK